jgi:hypothetical protein
MTGGSDSSCRPGQFPTAVDIGAVIAALAAIAAIRRSGERAGRLEERLNQQEEIADAERRMLDASRDRPRDRDDLARRMRDGTF